MPPAPRAEHRPTSCCSRGGCKYFGGGAASPHLTKTPPPHPPPIRRAVPPWRAAPRFLWSTSHRRRRRAARPRRRRGDGPRADGRSSRRLRRTALASGAFVFSMPMTGGVIFGVRLGGGLPAGFVRPGFISRFASFGASALATLDHGDAFGTVHSPIATPHPADWAQIMAAASLTESERC